MNVYWKFEYNILYEIFLLASDFSEPKQFCDKQTDLISELLLDNLTLLSLYDLASLFGKYIREGT